MNSAWQLWNSYAFTRAPPRTWSRINEHTVLLRFLGIILRVLRIEVSVYNAYIINQSDHLYLTLLKNWQKTVSLIVCNRLKYQWDQWDRTLHPTSSNDENRIFRNQGNFLTVNLTSTEDPGGTFRNQRNFLTVSKSCLTIFRQLSDNESKSKIALHGLDPTSLKVGTNENGSACGRWLSIGI